MQSGMLHVPGGAVRMGSRDHYPEEAPVVDIHVDDVWWDAHPVTNRQFAEFVESTGHVTVAELTPSAEDFPGADPALLVAGSQLFAQTTGPVPLDDWRRWWRWQPGACWKSPQGPTSSWTEVADHPVVHVGWEDATAFARWAGKSLPTEAEWEHAARGGLEGQQFGWGDELHPGGQVMANTWQGNFPWRSDDARGHHRTSPVGSYPSNGYGLYDMIGNVWEWTFSEWTPSHSTLAVLDRHARACCGGGADQLLTETTTHPLETDRKVTKGGSHLCSPQYCRRYRPAARQGQGIRDTTSHVGFRCVCR